MFIFYNPNSCGINTGDCVIRALSIATGLDWHTVYAELCVQGYAMCDFGNSNRVFGTWLINNGYDMRSMSKMCSVEQFASDNPHGTFICCTGAHAVAVVDGNWIDSWDSGREVVAYYFSKG